MTVSKGQSGTQGRDAPRLNLLITQRALKTFGGSELYTVELAREMTARGHSVAIYCPRPGRMEKFLAPSGVTVTDRLSDVPFTPDLIHGHHHLPLMAALAHFPNVPAVHVWHGVRPWAEAVPRHPGIARYVITSAHMRPTITTTYGVDPARVALISNYVDTRRFSHVRAVPDRPRTALLFGQSGFYPEELQMLDTACSDNGLVLDKVGAAYGNQRPRPEYFLPDYDLVFAVGRSALEAMAVGCAVLPIVPQLAGTRVRRDTLSDWAALNFSPRYFTSATRFTSAWLATELAAWDAHDIAQVTQEIRTHFTMTRAFDQLEVIYAEVLSEGARHGTAADMRDYLEWLAGSADDVWIESTQNARENETLTDTVKDLQEAQRSRDMQVRFLTQLLDQLLPENAPENALAEAPNDMKTAILRSGLFDATWYLEANPDVAAAGLDPLEHYLSNGASEGRRPSPQFDTALFWQANPHLRGQGATRGATPLEHVMQQLGRVGAQNR